jgi:hypothetical protein
MSEGAFIPLPNLNLTYTKETSTSLSSNPAQNSTQTQQSTNQINITLNPSQNTTETNSDILSDTNTAKVADTNTGKIADTKTAKITDTKTADQDERVQTFKDRLIEIQTELLLCDKNLLKNLLEMSNRVILRKEDIVELIGILILPKESRHTYASVIDIETEPVKVQKCCLNFTHSFFVNIVDITINNSESFLGSEIATKMEKIFKISLKRCIV